MHGMGTRHLFLPHQPLHPRLKLVKIIQDGWMLMVLHVNSMNNTLQKGVLSTLSVAMQDSVRLIKPAAIAGVVIPSVVYLPYHQLKVQPHPCHPQPLFCSPTDKVEASVKAARLSRRKIASKQPSKSA